MFNNFQLFSKPSIAMANTPAILPELVCPTPKSSSDLMFRSGASWVTRSCVPSRLPTPTPSDSAISCSEIPCILPPSPSASPVSEDFSFREPPPKPTLLTLPPEILLRILWFCSNPHPNLYRLSHDQIYIDRIRRNHPDLPVTLNKSLFATCHTLRSFLLHLECRGAGLRISNIAGIRSWKFSQPIWTLSKEISIRWDDSGTNTWPWGIDEEQWALLKSRSDLKFGPREPQEEKPRPPPKRADQINMTGEKPKDPKAYMAACRAYLALPPPPPPKPKKHREGISEDLAPIFNGCETLVKLYMNFPGALEAFTSVVLQLPDEASIFRTVKTLHLRNGSEMCFPPPQKLFTAISRFTKLVELTVEGNCEGVEGLFSVAERKRRGVYVGETENISFPNMSVVRNLWGWECPALEVPEKPKGLAMESCVIKGMPGLGVIRGNESYSSGVWNSDKLGWPSDVREKLVDNGRALVVVENSSSMKDVSRTIIVLTEVREEK